MAWWTASAYGGSGTHNPDFTNAVRLQMAQVRMGLVDKIDIEIAAYLCTLCGDIHSKTEGITEPMRLTNTSALIITNCPPGSLG